MPENETEQITEQVEVTENQELVANHGDLHPDAEPTFASVDIKPEETKEESGASLISRIKARFTGEHAAKEETGEEISDEFVTAARQMNWSDEDTMAFASGQRQNDKGEWVASDDDIPRSDEQLKEMIPSLLGEDFAKADETSDMTGETESETKEEEAEDSQDGEELKQLREDVADLKERLGVREIESKETEKANFNQRASDLFDEASKEFEVFGKTDDLPKFPHNGEVIPTSPQMKARLEVYGMAQQLKETGMSGAKALEFSLNAYKGANLKVETQRNVIKDLKKREQTLGGKRVSHEATEAANLTGPETVAEVKRRHGK